MKTPITCKTRTAVDRCRRGTLASRRALPCALATPCCCFMVLRLPLVPLLLPVLLLPCRCYRCSLPDCLPAWLLACRERSPDETPLRDFNRDRLMGLLTERCVLVFLCSCAARLDYLFCLGCAHEQNAKVANGWQGGSACSHAGRGTKGRAARCRTGEGMPQHAHHVLPQPSAYATLIPCPDTGLPPCSATKTLLFYFSELNPTLMQWLVS